MFTWMGFEGDNANTGFFVDDQIYLAQCQPHGSTEYEGRRASLISQAARSKRVERRKAKAAEAAEEIRLLKEVHSLFCKQKAKENVEKAERAKAAKAEKSAKKAEEKRISLEGCLARHQQRRIKMQSAKRAKTAK